LGQGSDGNVLKLLSSCRHDLHAELDVLISCFNCLRFLLEFHCDLLYILSLAWTSKCRYLSDCLCVDSFILECSLALLFALLKPVEEEASLGGRNLG